MAIGDRDLVQECVCLPAFASAHLSIADICGGGGEALRARYSHCSNNSKDT